MTARFFRRLKSGGSVNNKSRRKRYITTLWMSSLGRRQYRVVYIWRMRTGGLELLLSVLFFLFVSHED
jgi:hypothetical protein